MVQFLRRVRSSKTRSTGHMGRPGVLRGWLAFFDVYNSNLAFPVVNGVGMVVSVEAADLV